MLHAIRNYLISQGHEPVFIDFHREALDSFIALYCWEKLAADMHDGTATHLIQLRVRDPDYDQAMQTCKELVELLDSGDSERLIPLNHPGPVIGRVRRLPIVLERQETNVTVYAEMAIWGQL